MEMSRFEFEIITIQISCFFHNQMIGDIFEITFNANYQ